MLIVSENYENIRGISMDIIYVKTEGKILAMILGAKFEPSAFLSKFDSNLA